MRPTISTNSQTASIVIIQGTYERFCAPAEHIATVYSSQQDFDVIVAFDEAAVRATTQENWLRFLRLVTEWRDQRGAMSSISEAAMCPAYQSILGMGPIAVPFLLAQLRSEGNGPDHWFWALKAISGADPVRDEDRGNLRRMAQAWLKWGQLMEYAW